jgi:hypothetical protein
VQIHGNVVGQLPPHAQDYSFRVLCIVYIHHDLQQTRLQYKLKMKDRQSTWALMPCIAHIQKRPFLPAEAY